MKKIGFITSQEEGLNSDDLLSVPYLEKNGFLVTPVIWDQENQRSLQDVDALIFRSCWNYHLKYSEFSKWLQDLKKTSLPIFNPLSVIEWNIDKKYLLNWSSTPKTKRFSKGTVFTKSHFVNILAEWNSEFVVVKPSISLNGQDTYLLNLKDFQQKQSLILNLFNDRDMLVQEFIPEIRTQGETSAIFFNKKFSHAVKKIPAKNEFRIHREYGGSRESLHISPEVLEYAQTLLNRIPEDLLYARIDLIQRESDCILIELELTDPMFYLKTDDQSGKRFADAVAEFL